MVRSLLRRFWCELADEAIGLLVLHRILRHRRRPPVRGVASRAFPGLFSGDPAQFYAPTPEPVEFRTTRAVRTWEDGTAVDDLAFPSHVQSAFPESDVVRLRRWRSAAQDTGLTVVGIDGIVQVGPASFDRLAQHLSPHGIETVMMDTPFNYRRTPSGYRPGQLIVGGDLDHQLSVSRQAVIDLWTVIRTLQASGRRVGLVGISFGGWLSLMTSVIAERLEFVVAMVPPVDMFRILRDGGTIVRAARRGLGRVQVDERELERISRAVSPHRWPSRVPGNRIVLHLAEHDRFVPNGPVERLARTWGARLVRHEQGHCTLAGPWCQEMVAGNVLEFVGRGAARSEVASALPGEIFRDGAQA